jgi:hypothetical protein
MTIQGFFDKIQFSMTFKGLYFTKLKSMTFPGFHWLDNPEYKKMVGCGN